tara:strand:+ start:790 stop:1137 length:348 start_codon:yes stop_codon:yes gene_type:complete
LAGQNDFAANKGMYNRNIPPHSGHGRARPANDLSVSFDRGDVPTGATPRGSGGCDARVGFTRCAVIHSRAGGTPHRVLATEPQLTRTANGLGVAAGRRMMRNPAAAAETSSRVVL